jgi:tetratricopeptide (TPR) repeat protein
MGLRAAWTASLIAAIGLRLWNALAGPMLYGYDGWAHVAYVLFLDQYQAIPYADQGWSFFHPPVYYALGALIAQTDDGDTLARGLALLGSAASLGLAALAGWLVARGRDERLRDSRAACIGFTGVAFLPVLIYTAPMPGNELAAAFLAATALCVFLANELRRSPAWTLDLAAGVLAGLALLTKVSAVVPLAAVAAAAALRALRKPARGAALRALLPRAALALFALLVIAGPYYARNVATFGTPLVTSHDHPRVKAVEASQPPGERTVMDFIRPLGWTVWRDSSFDSPGVLRSVWGSVYLNTWFDTYRASQFTRWTAFAADDYPIHRWTLAFALLGVIPTGFALLGATQMLRRAWRDPDATIDATLSLVAFASLAFFAGFAYRIPTFAAVKASYLLALSLPWGWALASGLETALTRSAGWRRAGQCGCAALGLLVLLCCAVLASGIFLPRRLDHRDIHALRAHFGDTRSAQEWLRRPIVADHLHSIEILAAIDLAEGRPARARDALRAVANGPVRSEFVNTLAVATALAGNPRQALEIWNRGLRADSLAELQLNRGVVRALTGDLAGARKDLESGLAARMDLGVAWQNLAWVEAALGNAGGAARAAERANALDGRAPRGFPYGIGDGDLDYAGRQQRWLLQLTGEPNRGGLQLYAVTGSRDRPAQP